MRLVFAGTAEFALPALETLAAHHDIARVLTQPDRPAGRGRRPRSSPARTLAERLNLSVATPERLDAAVVDELVTLAPEVLVVVAYGLLIPDTLLQVVPHGGLNVHPSLLPRWRGAAPVERALAAGDEDTGVAIMQMDAGLDTGPVYRLERTLIGRQETAGELSKRLAQRGAELLLEVLAELAAGTARSAPQTGTASYAARIDTAEARLDFSRSASELERRVRAFNPRPGAWAECAGERVRILRAEALSAHTSAPTGQVMAAGAAGIDVACGEGCLRLLELQRPGRRVQTAAEQTHGRDWRNLCFR
ncbi:MAG: methionyl-tRNA formyltransferase [Gammaproteobacteria bacterium]